MKVDGKRKRKLDTSYAREEHKQADFGAKALAAGHQTKNVRVQPLISKEMEPGKVVEEMLKEHNPLMKQASGFSEDQVLSASHRCGPC